MIRSFVLVDHGNDGGRLSVFQHRVGNLGGGASVAGTSASTATATSARVTNGWQQL